MYTWLWWAVGCAGVASIVAGPARAGQFLYLSSIEGQNITAYEIDGETGELAKRSETTLPGRGGAMTFSPDRRHVYAALTTTDGASVCTLRRTSAGDLKRVKVAEITSRAPYLSTDPQGRLLLAAHYGEGEVTVYRIAEGVCTGELLERKATSRTAHCIETDPSGRFVFVPHTAPNRVYQFLLDGRSGKLTPNDPTYVGGPDEGHQYHGPRHYAHHPTLPMGYTSNETGGGISSWKFDAERGMLELAQTLSTLPPDYSGGSAAADIRITPDGRFAYVSNRDVRKLEGDRTPGDSLCAIALDEQGGMKVIGHAPAPHFPRTFCIDVSGRWLYVAGQRDNRLWAMRIDPRTGVLSQIAEYETAAQPIWAMCAETR